MKSLALTASAIALACLALTAPAQAALTLTINTANETFTWSGSATSDNMVVAAGTLPIRIAANGDSSTSGNTTGTGQDSLALTPSFSGFFFADPDPGLPTITSTALFANLGNLQASFGTASGTINVVGDNVAYSYSGLSDPDKAVLEGLDGGSLFFQLDGSNVGSSAGSIVTVVPEPSALALLSCAGLLLLRRRR